MADIDKEIDNRFGYHKPLSDEVVKAHEKIRAVCGGVAHELVRDGLTIVDPVDRKMTRELSCALTSLEEASFWFNANIARNQPVPVAKAAPVDKAAEAAALEDSAS